MHKSNVLYNQDSGLNDNSEILFESGRKARLYFVSKCYFALDLRVKTDNLSKIHGKLSNENQLNLKIINSSKNLYFE